MKRWLRILIPVIEATIVLGVIYFEPTYCVRGKLWNEAFFEDRSTSYWRDRVDRWMRHFESSEEAAAILDWTESRNTHFVVWNVAFVPRTPTYWERVQSWLKWPSGGDG